MIESLRREYAIYWMCDQLQLKAASYFAWRRRGVSSRDKMRAQLRVQIQQSYDQSDGTYGYRRIGASLKQAGYEVGGDLVLSIMRELGLRGLQRGRSRGCTKKDHRTHGIEDRLQRQFKVARPGEVWVADATELRYRGGRVYFAVVMDLASRLVVGWALSTHQDSDLMLSALQMRL